MRGSWAKRLAWAACAATLLGGEGSRAAEVQGVVKVGTRVGTVIAVEARGVKALRALSGGKVEADVAFRLSANVDRVTLQCFATDLYKASYPGTPYFLAHQGGALLSIPAAVPIHGGSPYLPFLGPPVPGEGDAIGFVFYPTETRVWESAFLSFSHDALTTFTWQLPALPLPQGEYGGYVKLTAFEVPR